MHGVSGDFICAGLFFAALLVCAAAMTLLPVLRFIRRNARPRSMARLAASLGYRFYRNEPTTLITGELLAEAGAGGGTARDKRAATIAHWALELMGHLGMSVSADDPGDMIGKFVGQFAIFHHGWGSNVLVGPGDQSSVRLFDYQYGENGSGTSHHAQVCLMDLPIAAPRLQVRPEGALDRLASWAGREEIGFESQTFSRRCHVKCEEPKFAYDILNLRLIEYLLARPDLPIIEMNGPHMLLYFDGQGHVERFRWLVETGSEILRSIPDYVLHQRGIGAAAGGTPS